jgi:hypothetical protein
VGIDAEGRRSHGLTYPRIALRFTRGPAFQPGVGAVLKILIKRSHDVNIFVKAQTHSIPITLAETCPPGLCGDSSEHFPEHFSIDQAGFLNLPLCGSTTGEKPVKQQCAQGE